MEKIRCVNCMEEITGTVCPHCGYKEGDTEQTTYGLKRNSILHGKYLIGNVLGQGGFGITYIGLDIALEIKVAIKEYFPMGYVSRDCTQSNQLTWNNSQYGQEQWKKGNDNFLKEARRMAKLDVFPEIVRVRDIFVDNQTSYIVMDYVEGENLKTWLMKNGMMKFSECINMFLPLMNSLNEVHAFGLVHRDISPDNIMVLPNGKVRLLDLGAAKDLTIEHNGTSQLVTKKGFSPVEQYLESGKIGPWTDVYALSATIYYCITGKMVPESMERALSGDTLTFDVPVTETLSETVKETLRQGLAVKPEDRIQTVGELSRRLQETVEDTRQTDTAPVEEPAPQEASASEEKAQLQELPASEEKAQLQELPASEEKAQLQELPASEEKPDDAVTSDKKVSGGWEKVTSVLTVVAAVAVSFWIMYESDFAMGTILISAVVTAATIIFMNLESDEKKPGRWKKAGSALTIVVTAVTFFLGMCYEYELDYKNNDSYETRRAVVMIVTVAAAVVTAVTIVIMNYIRSDRWKKAGAVETVVAAVTALQMIDFGYAGYNYYAHHYNNGYYYDRYYYFVYADFVVVSVFPVVMIVLANLIRSGRWKKSGMILVEVWAVVAALLISDGTENKIIALWLTVIAAALSIVHLVRIKPGSDALEKKPLI